jgi:hypothetical protein
MLSLISRDLASVRRWVAMIRIALRKQMNGRAAYARPYPAMAAPTA